MEWWGNCKTMLALKRLKVEKLKCTSYKVLSISQLCSYRFRMNLRLTPKSCVVTGYEFDVRSGLFI